MNKEVIGAIVLFTLAFVFGIGITASYIAFKRWRKE